MPEEIVTQLKDWFYIHSLTMVRMAAVFNTLPMLNKQITGSAMIRNGIVMCLALFLFPLVESQEPATSIGTLMLFALIMKEVMIGMFIGFIINIPFWAVEAAGFFIDNQRGASMASSMNAMSGSESSPMGIMFAQTFTTLYLMSGIFLIMLGSLFHSYEAWPVFEFWPKVNQSAVLFFLGQFDLIITLAVWLAAPIIICMFITEWGIALISRSAPQLNVFILAMPIKSAVAVAILVLYVATIMTLGKQNAAQFPSVMAILGQYLK
ncbi:type III secretion system export apparatus subunit SctT [Sansalvadorimonas sp. 2012CJ34-2]|uniref:Type III secretion system export apparatus subunit SctT n=1 Tax=Parendozoicomonas callyspongiae TaxID=2942213 RepID=A0ABT0PL48_9GAMM|nr:type III secretion system export apparatus subunit SctT [Sansalvadorimonas sp. 2012CJ34-2]MCL6271706.1 type III secretion system export apparatus subunit SctT [Sansalvadorimonas sp. 2012CJ34-2]